MPQLSGKNTSECVQGPNSQHYKKEREMFKFVTLEHDKRYKSQNLFIGLFVF